MRRLIAGSILLLAVPAAATIVIAQTFEQMTQTSQLVVRGTVGQVQSAWDEPHRGIWTWAEVSVSETLKGTARPGSIVMIRNPGGVLKEIAAHVAGAPQFTAGEEVILFLEQAADAPDVYVVNAMAAGKVTLERNHFGQLRASRDVSGLSFYERGGVKPRITTTDKPEDLGSAEQFLARIRLAVTHAAPLPARGERGVQ